MNYSSVEVTSSLHMN